MKKYRVIIAAVFVELLLGFKYAWGIFDRILQREYGFTATETQLVFSMTVTVFAAAFLVSGRIQDRFGPRLTTLIGALFYGTGLVIAGLGGPRFATLFLGAGVMIGLAIAFGYIGPLATAQKWFPARKGLATGVVIGAYGFGAFFVGSAAQVLLSWRLNPFQVFLAVGLVASVLMALVSLGLSLPEEYRDNSKRSLRLPKGLLKGAHFWALAAGLFSGTFAGLIVVGSVQRIGGSLGAAEWAVAIAVQAFAAGSVSGRVGWGLLLEMIGAKRAITASLVCQGACLVALAALGSWGGAFLVCVFLVGFNYGGCFVLYVAEVAELYGPERVGTVYSAVYLVYSIAGLLGPLAAGVSFDASSSYAPALISGAVVSLAGAACFRALLRRVKDTGEGRMPPTEGAGGISAGAAL